LQQEKRGGHARLISRFAHCARHFRLDNWPHCDQFPRFEQKDLGLHGMRGFKEKGFNDRLDEAAKAKQAQLERARAKSPQNDPEFAARQAERKRQAEERAARIAQRAAEKAEEARREAERKAAEAAAQAEADRLAEEERLRQRREEADRLVALAAEQKAARDARYAARKNKKR
jgi:hypothetical protein